MLENIQPLFGILALLWAIYFIKANNRLESKGLLYATATLLFATFVTFDFKGELSSSYSVALIAMMLFGFWLIRVNKKIPKQSKLFWYAFVTFAMIIGQSIWTISNINKMVLLAQMIPILVATWIAIKIVNSSLPFIIKPIAFLATFNIAELFGYIIALQINPKGAAHLKDKFTIEQFLSTKNMNGLFNIWFYVIIIIVFGIDKIMVEKKKSGLFRGMAIASIVLAFLMLLVLINSR